MPALLLPDKILVAFSFAGEQRKIVRSIAEAVQKELGRGKVFFDEWFEAYLAGDDADLKLQKLYGKKCELIVVCVSQRYGEKAWTKAEHRAIRARQMELAESKVKGDEHRILPLRVGNGDVDGIPFNSIVPDVSTRSPTESAELIVARLRMIIPNLKTNSSRRLPAKSWPKKPPGLVWPMADHVGVRMAFGSLLTPSAPWSFLAIRGSSETGKSHITKQMLANVIPLPGVACGRFDFKGTTDVEAEVNSFAQFLQVKIPEPKVGVRLNERLGHILTALKARCAPALLVFDTYEAAGEAEDWVDKHLLPNLLCCPWLRVVIAGQRVPDPKGAIWLSKARITLELLPPPPADWFDYGKQHKPDLTLLEVETACRLASHKASLLAQLLGPTT
ncbi:MAG: TIR domain-containing protein [Chthoniobacteraceae bacterium]